MNDRTKRKSATTRYGSSERKAGDDDDDNDDNVDGEENEEVEAADGAKERARPRPGEIMIMPADVSGP